MKNSVPCIYRHSLLEKAPYQSAGKKTSVESFCFLNLDELSLNIDLYKWLFHGRAV
jgi:hypothetical protein